MPSAGLYDKTGKFNLRTRTYTGKTVTDCLLQAKQELGADAIIVSRKTYKKGALFGKWGGKEVVEMTFGTYLPPTHPFGESVNPNLRFGSPDGAGDGSASRIQELEAQLASLKENVQSLSEKPKAQAARSAVHPRCAYRPIRSLSGQEAVARLVAQPAPPAAPRRPRRKEAAAEAPAPESGLPGPHAAASRCRHRRPAGASAHQRSPGGPGCLRRRDLPADSALPASANRPWRGRPARVGQDAPAGFRGDDGRGQDDDHRQADRPLCPHGAPLRSASSPWTRTASGPPSSLQKYGEILRVPVKVAHDKLELIGQLNDFAAEGKEIVLLDTAGRSPNEMIPLGETANLFDGVGAVQKYLTLPAVLGPREMDNVVTKFQSIFTPDAVILTKLDEASDHTCFGRLLTLQAKYGLPLAFVTTGQKVPDDIVLPDAHAIASRILSAPLL